MSEARAPYSDFLGQFIAGKWLHGSTAKVEVDRCPYSGDAVAELTLANAQDVDGAFRAAAVAQVAWGRTGPTEKIELFRRVLTIVEARRQEIIGWIVKETGSTLLKAGAEWNAVRGGLIEAMTLPSRVEGRIMPIDQPGKQSFVFREPVGVVGVISPWNFPMHLSHRSIAPALATGNAVVVKPAIESPITGGLLLAKIYEEAGLPAGLLNVIVGEVPDVGDAFVAHPVPRIISFTGSTRVGKHIAGLATSGTSLKHIGLELGGNAPLVVLDDADLEAAASAAVFARFLHSGQICMSANRIIVERGVYDEFVRLFTDKASRLKYGNPSDPDTIVGPLISERQLNAALARVAEAEALGFELALGGPPEGLVMPPHVFVGVDNSSAFAQAEQFAPIAVIIQADGDVHALELANATDFGLASSVFTRDVWRGMEFARGIHAGMTHVNDITVADSPFNMFGGEKNSGLGRFNGDWIVDEMTRDHWVTCTSSPPAYPT